jgi:hypothetical protein
MNNNYCPLIFHSIYIERSFHTIDVAPCCLAKKQSLPQQSINLLNNDYFVNLREQNKNNLKSTECSVCWDLEAIGGESKRQVTIDQYKRNAIPLDYDTSLYSIDYNTLPICNAKCIICGPKYSSAWAATKGISLKNIIKDNYDHMTGLDLNDVRTLYFNGGEPLLTKEHCMVLSNIKDLSKLEVEYNTNGSCFPDDKILSIWSNLKKLTLYFSVDAVGLKFEEIRDGLKWNEVSSNIKKLNSFEYINVQCSYTIGTHNLFDLEETINWFKMLPNFDPYKQFHVHWVNSEHCLSLKNISPDNKIKFLNELKKFKKFHWFEPLYRFVC